MMADVNSLKYDYTFLEVMKLKEWIEMMTAIEMAQHKDHEAEMKKLQNK